MKDIQLFNGDCLEIMKEIPSNSVDMILADLPYGTTSCKWDVIIPFEKLWGGYERVIKKNGAIVLFGSEPFSSSLRMSNIKLFKYDWIWKKSNPSNIALANKQPMKYHEIISVFYREQPTYNKQMIKRDSPRIKQAQDSNYIFHNSGSEQTGLKYIEVNSNKYDKDYKNPSSILEFNSLRPNSIEFVKHPTQKPTKLLEYIIETYTNKNEVVLDNTMGSGSTMVACLNTGRKGIGIEMEKKYFDIAVKRVEEIKN